MQITWLVLVGVLVLMASGSQPTTPDPSAPPEEYRQQVAASIQALTSGRRPRDPVMSGASTSRLILEGIVENVRIYRLHKEEKAQEAKEMEKEERRKRERRSRWHGRDNSRERRHCHLSSRPDGDGEGHRRRKQHRRGSGHGDGSSRQRSQTEQGSDGRGIGNHGDQPENGQPGQHRNRSGPGDVPHPSHGDHLMSGDLPVGAAVAVRVAEAVEERLFGPDGTPFGHLPTRGKGVGILAHAKTTYQHIKAEQDAGQRSKGPAEKLIQGWLEKKKNAKSATRGTIEEEELLIERNTSSRDERSSRHGGRRRRRRSRDRGGNRDVGRDSHPVFAPVVERGEPSVRQPTVSRPPLRQPSVHVEPPAQPASVRSYVPPAPSVRGATSVREVDADQTEGSRSGSRVPTIRVQLPTPPEQANSVRSPTPSVQEVPSRFQSPELRPHEPATAAWSPTPSRSGGQPLTVSTPLRAVATPYPTAPSVVDIPAPVVPRAAPLPPPSPPPPPPAPVSRPVVGTGRDALLTSIQVGVKLKKVSEDDRKDASAARKDEARIEDVTSQTPMYEETQHSHDVEALEHAQAVEERERRQEEERVARSKTPFIAPQPRPNLPVNFQDELAAKLGRMKLKNPDGDSVSEAAPIEALNIVRPRASNETWRIVFSDQEPYSEPDQAFRERLGSARDTARPLTAVTTAPAAPVRGVTPDPDVFVKLSADIAGPGWSFGNVSKNESS